MRKWTCLAVLLAVLQQAMAATDFETATQAVAHMKVGWNLGNTLEANGQTITDITNEGYWGQQGMESETCWGQPKASAELMQMYKNAGFGAIRVPVTWYNHMDASGKVNAEWMARVKEVVGYVIQSGMYCILNVHHDTGADGKDRTSWLKASETYYHNYKARYEQLWQQIATEFKDYDQHLLFESYNEMLDQYSSWCFATFARSGGYLESESLAAYTAINNYAQSFVNVVRATGGNNAQRNLIVNTYAACCGYGNWSSHLQDPLKQMKLPTDQVENHLIFEVHDYPSIATEKNGTITNRSMSDINSEIDATIANLKTYLASQGAPIVMGEWGTSSPQGSNDYDNRQALMAQFAKSFVQKLKVAGITPMYWMGLTDGMDRLRLRWTQPAIKDAILKGWYGDNYAIPDDPEEQRLEFDVTYDGEYAWQEVNLYHHDDALLSTSTYKGIRLELAEKPASGALQMKFYGVADGKEQWPQVTATGQAFLFEPATLGNGVRRITLQHKTTGTYTIHIKGAWLIKQDGTEEELPNISNFWGCQVTAVAIPAGIQSIPIDNDMQGNVTKYVRNGQLVIEHDNNRYNSIGQQLK